MSNRSPWANHGAHWAPLLLVCSVIALLAASSQTTHHILWSWGPVIPLAKTCRATAAAGDRIITVGGTWWERLSDEKKVKRWTNAAYLLDTKKMEWRVLPDYPLPVGYAFAAAVENRIYVIGGRSEQRGNPETFVLDLTQMNPQWIPGPALPHPRWGHVGGVIDGDIYIAGGSEGDPSQTSGFSLSASVLVLDLRRSGSGWRQVATLPRLVAEWKMGAACRNRLYLMGGLVTSNQTDKGYLPQTDAMAFDVSRSEWKQLRPLPTPMGSGAAVAVESKFIIMTGGFGQAVPGPSSPDHKARTYFTSDCLLYDVDSDSYQFLTPAKMPVADQGFVYLNKKLFLIGGEDAPYQTRTDLVQIGDFF